MTSVAAGLALEGKTVFTYSIGNFSTLRCLEQIRNDVCYHQANVKIVSVGGGFSYGAMGITHHATEDIAILRSLPGITIFVPCDPHETIEVIRMAIATDGPCYIRLGKGGETNLSGKDKKLKIGKASKLRNGNDIAIFATGPIIEEAIAAADIMYKKGIDCAVYSFATIKPLDAKLIVSVSKKIENIFTLEEHNIIGGLGSAVAEVLLSNNCKSRLVRMGLNDVYSAEIGTQSYLRSFYNLDANGIVNTILANS
jgi:transketolase